MKLITETHVEHIRGTISCRDRIIIRGTLPPFCYTKGILQIEYATDIVFDQQSYLQTMYDTLTKTAIHTVKPENIATFLEKKLHGNYQDDMGNRFNTRIEVTRTKDLTSSMMKTCRYSLPLHVVSTISAAFKTKISE